MVVFLQRGELLMGFPFAQQCEPWNLEDAVKAPAESSVISSLHGQKWSRSVLGLHAQTLWDSVPSASRKLKVLSHTCPWTALARFRVFRRRSPLRSKCRFKRRGLSFQISVDGVEAKFIRVCVACALCFCVCLNAS